MFVGKAWAFEDELASTEEINGYWDETTPIWKVKEDRPAVAERKMTTSMVVTKRVILERRYHSADLEVLDVGLGVRDALLSSHLPAFKSLKTLFTWVGLQRCCATRLQSCRTTSQNETSATWFYLSTSG